MRLNLQQNIALKHGQIPIYEPGLKEIVERNVEDKRLSFTTDKIQAIQTSEAIFMAVGTPQGEDHKADLRFIKQAAADVGKHMKGYKIIVNKSTVPVGTADLVTDIIKQNQETPVEFDVISNPEFLREGSAIKDSFEK